MEKNKKVTKTKKYLTVFHWGGIFVSFRDSRKSVEGDSVICSGGRGGSYLHIRVEGNEELVERVKSELRVVEDLFKSGDESRFGELRRVMNGVYYELGIGKPYCE
jgi:hypothetical protein